jgi:hypothetical protein
VHLATNGDGSRAGGAAGQRFDERSRVWRRRALGRVFLVCIGLAVVFTVFGGIFAGQAKFYFGFLAGASVAAYLLLRASPPARMENWRLGRDGERRTAKALRALTRQGWWVWHDIDRGSGANFDHVLVGPAGVFLLDTKNDGGEGRIENGELWIRQLEDPDDGAVRDGIAGRMRGASFGLKQWIEATTGVSAWVQPVVVLWQRFPQRVAEVAEPSSVFFIQGEGLVTWLQERPARPQFDSQRVGRLVDDELRSRNLSPSGAGVDSGSTVA